MISKNSIFKTFTIIFLNHATKAELLFNTDSDTTLIETQYIPKPQKTCSQNYEITVNLHPNPNVRDNQCFKKCKDNVNGVGCVGSYDAARHTSNTNDFVFVHFTVRRFMQ